MFLCCESSPVFIDLDPRVPVIVHSIQDRGPPAPPLVHPKLIGFSDIKIQVAVIAL